MKTCRRCGESKPVEEFYRHPDFRDGRCSTCRSCQKVLRKGHNIDRDAQREYHRRYFQKNKERLVERDRQYRLKNRDEIRRRLVEWKYGLPAAEYDTMVAAQGNLCGVCRKPETAIDKRTGSVRRLSVDHHHSSGTVRSLVCSRCNTALGLLGEDPDKIRALLEYVESHALTRAGV